jgi:hypothetical protein
MPLKAAQTINRFMGILTVSDRVQVVRERDRLALQMICNFGLMSDRRGAGTIGP